MTSRPTAAAVLVLADTLRREPVIIEPDDRQPLTVDEIERFEKSGAAALGEYQLAALASGTNNGFEPTLSVTEAAERLPVASLSELVPFQLSDFRVSITRLCV